MPVLNLYYPEAQVVGRPVRPGGVAFLPMSDAAVLAHLCTPATHSNNLFTPPLLPVLPPPKRCGHQEEEEESGRRIKPSRAQPLRDTTNGGGKTPPILDTGGPPLPHSLAARSPAVAAAPAPLDGLASFAVPADVISVALTHRAAVLLICNIAAELRSTIALAHSSADALAPAAPIAQGGQVTDFASRLLPSVLGVAAMAPRAPLAPLRTATCSPARLLRMPRQLLHAPLEIIALALLAAIARCAPMQVTGAKGRAVAAATCVFVAAKYSSRATRLSMICGTTAAAEFLVRAEEVLQTEARLMEWIGFAVPGVPRWYAVAEQLACAAGAVVRHNALAADAALHDVALAQRARLLLLRTLLLLTEALPCEEDERAGKEDDGGGGGGVRVGDRAARRARRGEPAANDPTLMTFLLHPLCGAALPVACGLVPASLVDVLVMRPSGVGDEAAAAAAAADARCKLLAEAVRLGEAAMKRAASTFGGPPGCTG